MAAPKIKSFKLNMNSVNKKIAKNKKFNDQIDQIADKKFRQSKDMLMRDFNEHPVTREIEGGVSAGNVSGTLAGYGNLFSFIGFPSGSDPVNSVRVFLQTRVALRKNTKRDSLTKDYTVNIPEIQSFNFAKMPWDANSWVKGIETGISGFSYYMNKADQASRSGMGIQIDGKLRALNSSKGVPYMSEILNNFKKRILS